MNRQTCRGDRISTVIMIVLIILLLPILIFNLTLIIKGSIYPDTPPDVFGIAPLAVTSGSMDGDREDSFAKGSLIFVKLLDKAQMQSLSEGDIITFKDSGAYVTHRIVSIFRDESGKVVSFVTQGDANNATDGAVILENVVGKCVGNIGGLGDFAMFMQTPVGILIFVGVPVLLYVAYDVLRVMLYNRRVKSDNSAQIQERDAEIERLRALVEKQEAEKGAEQESLPQADESALLENKEK